MEEKLKNESANCGGNMFCPICGNHADIVKHETAKWVDGKAHYYTLVCPVCRSQLIVEWRTSKQNSIEAVNSLLKDIQNCNDSNCDACLYSKESDCMNRLITALHVQLQDYKQLLEAQ
jgi:uncharacterized protein YbaR (Trm112 family)